MTYRICLPWDGYFCILVSEQPITTQARDIMTGPSVFISYSRKDEEWKDRLVTHLGVLEQEGLLDLWDDRRIELGAGHTIFRSGRDRSAGTGFRKP